MRIISWVDWGSEYPEVADEDVRAAEEAIIEAIRSGEHEPITGTEHQHHPGGVPFFDNGTIFTCSMRYWGGIMYEALNPDGDDPMGYCEWAW